MKGSRFSKEQIIGVLRENEAGAKTEEVCHRHGISSATFYKWKAKYGGLELSEAKRLKGLERELDRLTLERATPKTAIEYLHAYAVNHGRAFLFILGYLEGTPPNKQQIADHLRFLK